MGLSILYFSDIIGRHLFLALAGGGALLAVIGWKDDKDGLTPRVRSFFHFLAASWAVYWLGGFPAVNVGFTDLYFSWAGSIIAIIGTVWMINLYNFMDGVDGIAGTEAVSVALICGILLLTQSSDLAAVCFLLAASVLGFLMWNWPPARIFMGDVGSGFLGFVFAVMAMWTECSGVLPFIIWMILLGVFIIDATVTLIKRLARGERLYEAHRSHVYQLAVQAGYSHKQVTCTALLINMLLGLISILALKHIGLLLGISIGVAVMLIIAHTILGYRFNVKITKMKAISKIAETEGHLSYAEVAALKDE
ncbi:MAG TPA: glycosyl transferase family 4 [Syntrophomonas sp.]|nr:glycosyl transferase family 4 [Syntrophomonas sp.]